MAMLQLGGQVRQASLPQLCGDCVLADCLLAPEFSLLVWGSYTTPLKENSILNRRVGDGCFPTVPIQDIYVTGSGELNLHGVVAAWRIREISGG